MQTLNAFGSDDDRIRLETGREKRCLIESAVDWAC